MLKLPVIVGFGGMNAAGRSSNFHSYKRIVNEVLPESVMESTWHDLACRMQLSLDKVLSAEIIHAIKQGTLIRRIEHFDPDKVRCHHKANLEFHPEAPSSLLLKKSKLSHALEAIFDVQLSGSHEVRLTVREAIEVLLPDVHPLAVTSAGTIPAGVNLDNLYHSHHHPRGLKLTVYGISDALNSLGIEWKELLTHIQPDQVSVYAGSALSQIDEHSLAGMLGQPLMGNRITAKMMPLSLAEMPADFVNSYVLNSVGSTGHNVGACATFLYNLKQGMQDIQTGHAKVVFVGGAEAPVEPDIIEGFRVMGALATDEQLCALDNTTEVNNRRACRPFSTNVGFTLAESVQFVVLMEDQLALDLGLTIYGSVADVFINADGNKKSIAGPGVGNYVTVAKAVGLARAILGQEGLEKTYVQAHGTGTPQNRTSESHILNLVAETFLIKKWPVTAIKSYVGHSIAVAAGDQLVTSLGVWKYGWIPGIKTIDHIASDVHQSHLSILQEHLFVGEKGEGMRAVVINSKGFGGNNATALVLSPQQTLEMLEKKYGTSSMAAYWHKNQSIEQTIQHFDKLASEGDERIVYQFGESVMDHTSVTLTQSSIRLSLFEHAISLPTTNPYASYS